MLSSVFLASLLSGLLLGVYAMLTGVERTPAAPRPDGGDVPARTTPPPPAAAHTRTSQPAVAAAATLFGMVGYLLLRYTTVTPVLVIVIAAMAAGLGMVGMLTLVVRWAARGAAGGGHGDQRYLLQGTPARVTRAVSAGADGEVEYVVDGARYATPARSLDGRTLAAGTDVAIDRVEDGVAYVEDWALVEERL